MYWRPAQSQAHEDALQHISARNANTHLSAGSGSIGHDAARARAQCRLAANGAVLNNHGLVGRHPQALRCSLQLHKHATRIIFSTAGASCVRQRRYLRRPMPRSLRRRSAAACGCLNSRTKRLQRLRASLFAATGAALAFGRSKPTNVEAMTLGRFCAPCRPPDRA